MNAKPVLDAINRYQTFLICTHVNPDPDALASQAALGLFLEIQGKQVFLISELAVPERFSFLPGMQKVKSIGRKRSINYDAVIITDAGDIDRVGLVKRLFVKGKPIINIDHHITNIGFGDVNYVVSDASSTCEVVFGLIKKTDVQLTRDIAELLYVGAMTDTGSFRYSNTSAKTHLMIADLMRFPIEAHGLYKRIYEQVPLNDLKYFTKLVSEFDSLYEGKLICLDLSRRIVKKFSAQFDLRDKIFGYLRTVEGVEVLIIFTEEKGGFTRVNFRSQGGVDVAQVAAKFQGGGHSKASGCTIAGDIKTARRKILPEIKRAMSSLSADVTHNISWDIDTIEKI